MQGILQMIARITVWVAVLLLILTACTVDQLVGYAEDFGTGIARVMDRISSAM